jgi:subtilisin-like proprotein convertase family protein
MLPQSEEPTIHQAIVQPMCPIQHFFINFCTRFRLLFFFWLFSQTGFSQTFNGTGGLLIPPGAPSQTVGITSSPCTVTGVGVLGPCVQIASVDIDVEHTFTGDVGVLLVAPNGAFLDLSTDNGGGGDNWSSCTFADGSPNITTGAPPYTGTWSPEGRATTLNNPYSNANPLETFTFQNTFNGINADGVWSLYINDHVAIDWGIINSWSITFTSGNAPIATPASLNACDNGTGSAIFNLTTLNSTVNNGTSSPVFYFLDMAATQPIIPPNAFVSGPNTVYARIGSGNCASVPVPITLTLSPAVLPSVPTVTITPVSSCNPVNGNIVFSIGTPGVYAINYTVVTASGGVTILSVLTSATGNLTVPYTFNQSLTVTLNTVSLVSSGCNYGITPVSADFTFATAAIAISGPNSICSGDNIDLSSITTSSLPITFHTGTPATPANVLPSPIVSPTVTTIYYAFVDAGSGCTNTVPIPINVSPSGTPVLGTATVCESNGLFNLTTLQDPGFPGFWSGPGVIGTNFNPSGQNGSITLDFSPSNSCALLSSTTITVTPADVPVLGTTTLCTSGGLFALSALVDPAFPAGVWSGPGVVGGNFNPIGQNGIVTISFNPTAPCALTVSTTIAVTSSVIPTLTPAQVCQNNGPIDLTSLEDPAFPGGTWSGPNVVGTTFNSVNAGTFTLTYLAISSCATPANVNITVDAFQTPSLSNGSACEAQGLVDLTTLQDPNFPSGTWSGTGVAGSSFDPSGLNGFIALSFTPNDPCTVAGTTTMTVSPSGTPNLGTATLCSVAPLFNLNTIADPGFTSGQWSGLGVVGNTFNPGGLSGDIALVFTPTDPCANQGNTIITVNPIQIPSLSTDETCANGGLLSLTPLLDPNFTSGTWSGQGVVGNNFNPTGLNGSIVIQFTPNATCTAAGSTSILVTDILTPDLGGAVICESTTLFNLNTLIDPQFPIGTWSGTGVTGNFFNPNGMVGVNDLTFTPTALCSGPSMTAIIVEPSGEPVLNTATICANSPALNLTTLQDPLFSSGTWSGQGVTANQFNPTGLSGAILLIFNPSDPCATAASTTVSVQSAQTPTLGTSSLCSNAAPINLNTLIDPSFPTGTWSGPGVSGTTFNPSGQIGNVNLSFTSAQTCVSPAITAITVTQVQTPALTSAVLCQNSATLDLSTLAPSTAGTGTWTGTGVVNNFFNATGQSGTVPITFTSSVNCVLPASTSITVNLPLQYNTLEFDCQNTTTSYVVSFNITGGDQSQYLVNNNPVGQSFLSNAIPSATPFSFIVTDANGCGPLTISGDFNCSCATFAGTMNITGPTVQLCQNQTFTGVFNQNETLDPDDILLFVLHDNPGAQLGNILATNTQPIFNFPASGTLNTPYYVSAVAGTSTSTNTINYTDGCLSVSQGVPVSWYNLTASAAASGSICTDDCIDIAVQANGLAPFQVIYTLTGSSGSTQDTALFSSSSGMINFCPANYALGAGNIQIQAVSINDANCTQSLNQSFGSITVSAPAVAVLNQTLCQGQSLTVGNQTFNSSSPTGSVVLQGVSSLGCDSIVQVSLSFAPSANSTYQQQICTGGSVTIGGTVFDQSNPSGIVILPNASSNGCDSTVQVAITFASSVISNFVQNLCPNQVVTIGGQTFSQTNPTGSVLFPNGSVLGCDSIVAVSLTFTPPTPGIVNQQLCTGGSLTIGTTSFNETNPTGSVVLPGLSASGCDSIVQVTLVFGASVINNLSQNLCIGQILTIGTQTFSQANPTGTVLFPNGSVLGCDSIVQIALTYLPSQNTQINQQLCTGQSLTVGGTVFNQANPTGSVVLANAATNGCDSIVEVNLVFSAQVTSQLTQTLCVGETLTVGSQTFTQTNPNGLVLFPNGAASGCDSAVQVTLSYYPVAQSSIAQQLCPGGQIVVGSTIFNQTNLNGVVTLNNAASSGCDSTVTVNLTFGTAVIISLNQNLCAGEVVTVGTQTFSQSNPTGSVTFPNGSVFGCDSIVNVALQYIAQPQGQVVQQICPGASINIGGTVFDQNNLTGTVILPNSSVTGCDSSVFISLTIGSAVVTDLSPVVCTGEVFAVGAQTFTALNPAGSVTFTNGSVFGCDSIVNVNLSFYTPASSSFTQVICPGETIQVGGTLFSQANPSGSVTLAGASSFGCDSLINVSISFTPSANSTLNQQLCTGGFITVGTTVFNQSNPTGSVILPNASALGCDSTVQVSLSFGPAVVNDLSQTLCQGEEWTVGTEIFSSTNPSGSVVFANSSVFGCDSIVQVNLSFVPPALGLLQPQLCRGDSIMINGEVYNEARSSGSSVLEGASSFGCDSTLMVELSFFDEAVGYLDTVLALADVLNINGTSYSITQPEGIAYFTSSSGCDSTLYITLRFKSKYEIAVPNAFDSQGTVPFVTVYGGAEVAEVELFQIYTRWGEQVFHRAGFAPNIPELGWDGQHRSRRLLPGVYVYRAEIRFIDGQKQSFTGDITLIK